MSRMWIKTIVLIVCAVAASAADGKKKDDARGKRNLQYGLAHHFAGPVRLERRISTGPPIPLYHSQFFPGPLRSYSPFHKGRPYSLPPPPYAVQMEPLVHYSQRDPLYDTNILSLNADGQDDLLTDNNHLTERVYGPQAQKQIVERPVYIKEPEPIIEIIIKESNVTLPPPPTPPPPPPKKKEQVQVFYVKYKKNPNGQGKESVIYDKPIPAISPPIEDEHEESPPEPYRHREVVTLPPPPSTTLRTVIRPDSETYHGPSGIKVTFGKESFDYSKRSSKPGDLAASSGDQRSVQFPQGRQLSSFPPSISRRPPPSYSFNSPPSSFRQPQPYQPFTQFRQPPFPRPPPQEYSTLPKFLEFSQLPKGGQNFPPPRPALPPLSRQPVPYQPFDSFKQQPQFRPETHFPITQRPVPFNHRPQFAEPNSQEKPQFQQSQVSQYHTIRQDRVPPHQYQQQTTIPQQRPIVQQDEIRQFQKPQLHHQQQFQQLPLQFQQQPSVVPPGGELIQSVPKYEQHISVQEPGKSPNLQTNQQQKYPIQPSSTNYNKQSQTQTQQSSNSNVRQQLREANALQESIRQSSPQFFNFQQAQNLNYYQTTFRPQSDINVNPKNITYSTTTTTTQRPTTTTKDPKVLSAQLPDEVPDDLRQQLLSSGILNNADISVLDYDKVGDIPLSALPPEQLSNFFSAGGAQQIAAGSEPVPAVAAASEMHEVKVKPEVQMKVVRYDPESEKGRQVQKSYVKDDATRVEPVVLNDERYNRYLPLKVNGAQFPIPNVPELKGKKISSVVVLAPVVYDFSSSRKAREVRSKLVEDETLKELIKNPTEENFKKFLEKENKTKSDQQSVILLVTGSENDTQNKEIFMYDVATRSVSKLDGELSSAFVAAAEANSSDDPQASASDTAETGVAHGPRGDLESGASERGGGLVDISGKPVEEDTATSGALLGDR